MVFLHYIGGLDIGFISRFLSLPRAWNLWLSVLYKRVFGTSEWPKFATIPLSLTQVVIP